MTDLLREDFDDLSLPALRQMAAYTQAVSALWMMLEGER